MITDEVLLKLMMWKDHEYIIYKHDTLGETIEYIERLLSDTERLRAALLKISELEPEGPLGNDCMAVSYASETARAALEEEKKDD